MKSLKCTRRQGLIAAAGAWLAACTRKSRTPEPNMMNALSPTQMPVVFVPHGGGPWPFMDEAAFGPESGYAPLRSYLETLLTCAPTRPKALCIISAHWEAPRPTLLSGTAPPMLYDYSGFPKETYEVQWPAPGAPEVAKRARDLLSQAKIDCDLDPDRGFDHGTFVPMALSVPDADIPTTQLSLKAGLHPQEHLEIGRALAPLRSEGVLFVGSGMSFHNMRAFMAAVRGQDHEALSQAAAFDGWLAETIALPAAERDLRLCTWSEAPGALACHPREEHLMPLMVVAGLAGDDVGRTRFRGELIGAPVLATQFGG